MQSDLPLIQHASTRTARGGTTAIARRSAAVALLGARARSRATTLSGRVAVARGLAERAALDALLQGLAEAQRPPVFAPERVTDVAALHLALLVEEVLDERDLAVGPELHLVFVVGGASGVRRPAGDALGFAARFRARRAHD